VASDLLNIANDVMDCSTLFAIFLFLCKSVFFDEEKSMEVFKWWIVKLFFTTLKSKLKLVNHWPILDLRQDSNKVLVYRNNKFVIPKDFVVSHSQTTIKNRQNVSDHQMFKIDKF
jgi:hypothetical protein